MNVPQHIQNRVDAKVLECIAIAENHFQRSFGFPTIEYSLKGKTAGQAFYRQGKIKLNSVLLLENLDDFINNTVPHEVAHLIDFAVNKDNFGNTKRVAAQMQQLLEKHNYRVTRKNGPHGPSWKAIMKLFGCKPARCHTYDVTSSARKTNSFVYECTCCDQRVTLGPKRHMREQSHPGSYRLSGHSGRLQFVEGPATYKPKVTKPKAGSKFDQACEIYEFYHRFHTRAEIILAMAHRLNIKHTTAQTYYYKAKNYYEQNCV